MEAWLSNHNIHLWKKFCSQHIDCRAIDLKLAVHVEMTDHGGGQCAQSVKSAVT